MIYNIYRAFCVNNSPSKTQKVSLLYFSQNQHNLMMALKNIASSTKYVACNQVLPLKASMD